MAKAEAKDLRGKTWPAFVALPEEFTLIRDPKHPLFDERVNNRIDEALVASIMARGVLQPIAVRKNGHLLEVVDGRQRVINALEANRRLKREGRTLVRIKFFIRQGEDKDLVGEGITHNEQRRPDVILIKAAKARRAMNFGATLPEIACDFGVTPETVENWLKLLDLHPDIRTAVADGTIKPTVAMRLARLPREKQLHKWRKLKRAGATNANAVRVVVGGKLERVCPPSRQQLRRVADAFLAEKAFLAEPAAADAYSFVAWVLGRISTDELTDCLSSAAGGSIMQAVKTGMGLK